MLPRQLTSRLRNRLLGYPAVALLGPRQVGKTTLAKSLEGIYFDLENPQDRLRLDVGWEQLMQSPRLLVLDEAQTMPEIFPRLRSAIDEDRKRNGRFLLLGSVSPALMINVAESLTGRLALCELTPLLLRELAAAEADNLWHLGGYPDGGILDISRFPDWQRNYLDLMAQRDLPQWGLPAQSMVTTRLFRMLAAIHGQVWNASQVGKSMGLSYHTVNTYVDFLEKVFLVRRLPSYAANLKKRLVRSPKIYWRDTGLLHALLGWEPSEDILTKIWVGASWEGWVIEQILAHLQTAGRAFQAFYLRTSDQYEIDLLLEYRNRLWAFEIKLSSVPDLNDLQRLKKISRLVNADYSALISRTSKSVRGRKEASLNLIDTLDLLLNSEQHPKGTGK